MHARHAHIFAWLATLTLTSAALASGGQTTEKYVPASTSILVLPATNISSDKWKELKEKEALRAREVVTTLFTERGFQMIPQAKADEALAKSNIDLKNEDNWTKSNLYKIGKEADANLVAFVLLKQTRQKQAGNILFHYMEGEAEIEVWLVDAKQETPLLNGEPARGVAKAGIRGASSRRLAAVQFAVQKAFDHVLKPYPKLKGAEEKKQDEKKQETSKEEKREEEAK